MLLNNIEPPDSGLEHSYGVDYRTKVDLLVGSAQGSGLWLTLGIGIYESSRLAQRAQYGLIKEHTQNHSRAPYIVLGLFLHEDILGSLDRA